MLLGVVMVCHYISCLKLGIKCFELSDLSTQKYFFTELTN